MTNRNNTYKTKINRLSGVLATLLTIVVAATIVIGVGFGIYGADVSKWFKPAENDVAKNVVDPTVIENASSNGIALMIGDAVVQSDGTVSKTLTATVTPASSANSGFDWIVVFNDASSTWAQGKTVTDYVTITKDSDNDLKATVTFVKHFSEQIRVIVSSKINKDINATATVDCYKDVLGVDINFTGNTNEGSTNSFSVHIGKDEQISQASNYFTGYGYNFTITPTYGDGTLDGTFELQLVDKVGTTWTDSSAFQFRDVVDHGDLVSGEAYPIYVMFNGERWSHQSEGLFINYYETPEDISLDETQIKF